MSGFWNRVNQWLYPAEFRIKVEDDEASIAVLVSSLMAKVEALARPTPPMPPAGISTQVEPEIVAEAGGVGKSFALELCNQVHRLSRSVKKVHDQGGSEAEKLKGHLDQLGKILHEHSVQWEDLTGQAYDPGRTDFEPLGEPKGTPGLHRKTIIACERPVIRLRGAVIQVAKGVVGKPPE